MDKSQIFDQEVQQILKSLGPKENQAVKDSLTFLRDAHREILLELASAPPESWQAYHLGQIERNIQRVLDEVAVKLGVKLRRQQTDFWGKGVELVENPLAQVGVAMSLGEINLKTLEAIQAHSFNYIKNLTADAGAAIRNELNWVLIGKETPLEAMIKIGRSLDDPGIFKTVYERADSIVRNELNYAFSVANQDALSRAAEYVDGLEKEWQHNHNPKMPRPGHVQTHGQRRKAKEMFDVPNITVRGINLRTEQLMHPRDRINGSPGNTINCGCDSVPVLNF